jgi:hypothetical protein
MTGHRIFHKGDRALELFEKGLEPSVIAQRLGGSLDAIHALIKNARARREREAEKLRRLADAMGANV